MIQSVFQTLNYLLANAYILKQEFFIKNQNSAFSLECQWKPGIMIDNIRLKIYLLLLYYDSVARGSREELEDIHILPAFG